MVVFCYKYLYLIFDLDAPNLNFFTGKYSVFFSYLETSYVYVSLGRLTKR